ncbi:hydrogenase small subunit [Anaerocolumna sp. MB42-C2]|uniref:hydrogenase small subunit n=1 Tax=Anaerocolumna sp. MB42-C2 TaxID=3070997 RepID=UPI0027E17A8E|nr:hydrogenase small subunit [Anaerocolumna sp. MB42-C2]WMJ86486.1 hydrogenase small subunit [Anaerocolumna sp. MB42-C2]
MEQAECPLTEEKLITARRIAEHVLNQVKAQSISRMKAIWLEVTGCSGNIISFMDSDTPNLYEILTGIIDLRYSNILMGAEGEYAFERFLETLDTEFILLVDGAVSTNSNGMYNIIANYQGRRITAMEAVNMAGEKAKYIVSVGTCASYGGISAARPNPSGSLSVPDFLNRPVIRLPGCSSHPDWVLGTLAHLIGYGVPLLDEDSRPVLFYGSTVHDNCTRRGFFDNGIYARNFGEEGCMFEIGCRGPVTRADCPRRKWNGYVNWPVGDNSCCIGCTQRYFPDGMEPFVRY